MNMKREPLTVGYVARLFDIDKSLVKSWSKWFAEYLSSPTNNKGEPRTYTQSDLRVFAVIYENYDPSDDDITSAYSGVYGPLNSDDQYEERYIEFAYLNSPIFQEIPSEFEYSKPGEHGVIIGGMADPAWIDIARAYRLAADMLVDTALKSTGQYMIFNLYDVVWPILFNYRHSIEMYLKILTGYSKRKHSIESLINSLREKYKPLKINDWIEHLLYEWSSIDDYSTAFRYPHALKGEEYWVDFHHLKTVMGILCEGFDKLVMEM
ncbi:MAG TPA: hypothetical protein PKO09_01925 [Anaerolineae bacterium]|nr:hypothetical protein [Anaerolineae bacterium]